MSSFAARLHMPGQAKIPLSVEIDISGERMSVSSGDQHVADWPIEALAIDSRTDGFHVIVDAEEMVLKVTDPEAFAKAVGIPQLTSSSNGNGTNRDIGLLSKSTISQRRFDELSLRLEDVKAAITSEVHAPDVAFSKWLRFLKEVNLRHGQGSLSSQHFYQLNSEALELIPDPNH